MNRTQLYIENIGLGLGNLSNLEKLNLQLNEYVVVGQRNNNNDVLNPIDNEYNLIVNNNGIGINATRRELLNTNAGLLINNNIVCNGSIIAKNIEFDNISFGSNLNAETLGTLIKSVNSNLLFFTGYSNNLGIKNIYTPNYLTIGNYYSTYSNSHPLKINDSPNGKSDNLQFGIYNNINNQNEPVRFTFGMMGYNQNSPAIISTTEGMPLTFHISKSSSFMDDLYSNGLGLPEYSNANFPNLAIDINNCININKDKYDLSIYQNNKKIEPVLFVNGYAIISNLFTNDYYTNSILHLDDIYVRRNGLTLKANQIIGGDFLKQEFFFNSNLYIGKIDNPSTLFINGSANITNSLNTNNLVAYKTSINGIADFNKTVYFNNTTVFNDDITIDKSLNINNDLFINGYRINISNIDFATNGLNYDYGCNLNISGRLGTGILNTDTYDHQFNIIKRDKERFEIFIQDYSGITADSSKVYIGHTTLDNLNGNIDNSFIIFTQKNIRWHNIYFYAGKDRDGTKGIKSLIPTFAIMENNKVGVNTKLPEKNLDVVGDIITDDYYIRKNNNNYRLNYIYYGIDNSSILNVNNLDINLQNNISYLNKKSLNITGGINSYDGYYENNNKLATFKIFATNNIASTFNNIGVGVVETNNYYQVPLQVRNTNTNNNNNTIIRLYRGVKGGGFNNNSIYTGIDFCDYDMPIKIQNRNNYKWFIYKNNNDNDNGGTLQIGYTDNTYNPTHSCMNFYFNKNYKRYFIDINNPEINYNYDINNAVAIKGNVQIEGNVNLVGDNVCYKINGAIVGSFSNPAILHSIANSTNSYYTNNINDISLIANKLIFLPNKTTILGYNDPWIFNKINSLDSFNNNSPIFIYNNKDYTDDNIPPIITRFYNKSYRNYNARPDIASIELGILSDITNEGIINNKVNFNVKGYTNNLTIFELTPNNNYPFITCVSHNNKNQINFGNGAFLTSNIINYDDCCIHIYDDLDCLLRLTNNNNSVKLSFANNLNKWDMIANSNLNFNYNNTNLLNLTNEGILSLNNSSLNINSIVNIPSLELINNYYNDYNNPNNSFNIDSWIKIDFNKISTVIEDIDDIDSELYSSKFIYKIYDSNLPSLDIDNNIINNYYINNSNFIYNNDISLSFSFDIHNIEIDYRNLNTIITNPSLYRIDLIPDLVCYNPSINATFKTFNTINHSYNLIDINKILSLYYKVPLTVDDEELYIEGIVNSISNTSNYNSNIYYDISLNTYLKVKDKTLFNYNTKTVNETFIVNDNTNIYHYNTTNIIYYYPLPNISIADIQLNIGYDFYYQNSFIIPTNFLQFNDTIIHTTFNNSNVIINQSNSFLKSTIAGNTILHNVDATNYKKYKLLSTNIIHKIQPIEINDINVIDIILSFTKNNYYEVYDFDNNNPFMYIPINVNKYQPHLILKNRVNSKNSSIHKIYSYEDNYEIYLDNKKLLSLDNNGSINTNGGSINVKDVYFTGDIYNNIGGTMISITSNLNHIIGSNFYIQKNNISLNSSNIYLNPSVINKGGVIINGNDINDENNLFQINNYVDNDNFIVLKSISSSSYINFFNTTSIYKLGVNNGNFGIWRNMNINNNNLTNVINFNYDSNNNLNIDINGNIRTSNNFSINDIKTYTNNDQDYKLRIFGNLKVDGVVMSSSDKNLKRDINKIENALDKLEKLTGVSYFHNNNLTNHREMGLIAQDVKEIVPEVVYEDEKGYLNIAYGNLIGLVVEAIKELRNEIKNNK
jgi:hypothetical protein